MNDQTMITGYTDMHIRPNSIVYQMDNMDFMRQMPDKYYDLAVVDPEYGIGVNHNMGRRKGDKNSDYKKCYWDKQPPPQEYFDELFRLSVNQIIWGANYFISRMPYDSSCWLMWDKKFSDEITFAQYEMAFTSFDSTCKKFELHPSLNNNRIHPTQKPVALYDWIYKNYLPNGGKVLDTHLGSQSNRIAAHKRGNIVFDACELDGDYFNDGNKRFDDFLNKYNPAELNPITSQGQVKLF